MLHYTEYIYHYPPTLKNKTGRKVGMLKHICILESTFMQFLP